MVDAIVLAILASFLWGIGIALQKKGLEASFPKITLGKFLSQILPILKTLLKNGVWVIGLFCMIGGMGCFAYALASGDISLVQPLVNLTMVVATLVGVFFLKEKVSGIEWGGIAVMLIGVVFIALEIKINLDTAAFPLSVSLPEKSTAIMPGNLNIMLMLGVFVLITIAAVFSKKVGLKLDIAFTLSIAAGLCFALSNVMGKIMTQRVIEEVGAFSFVEVNALRVMAFDFPLLIIILANLFGFSFQQTAFANGRVALVAPVQTIFANTVPIIAAIMIFNESFGWSRGFGICLSMVGVAMMAFRKEENQIKDFHDPKKENIIGEAE